MWDLIVSVHDHCLSFCFAVVYRSSGNWKLLIKMTTKGNSMPQNYVLISLNVIIQRHQIAMQIIFMCRQINLNA